MPYIQNIKRSKGLINLANVCQQENKKYRGKKRVTLINLPIVDFLEIYDNELGFTYIAPSHEHSKFGETYLHQPFWLRCKVFLPAPFSA